MLISLLVLPLSNPCSYVGRGQHSICSMRLGGKCHDRIYHVDRVDEFDVTHSGFFVNSSLVPVLRFRRSLFLYVMSFLELCCMGSQRPGLLLYGIVGVPLFVWALLVLSLRLSLGPIGSPLIFMGFYKWAMDTLALLSDLVLKAVHHRQTARLQAWSNWIREDLTSHPYQWLRPEFFPPASLPGL